jgi:ABC-type branched-subunit amino acid transport system ATPase component
METVETNVLAGQYLHAGYGTLDPILRPVRWARRERALRAIMDDTLARLRLDHNRGKLVDDLSFGNARFVELAAVLMLSPDVLLLDEPTTGLDLGSIERLHELLASLRNEGKSVLLVAHNVSFVMGLCDHVYVMANGKALTDGSADEVRRDPAVIDAYFGTEGAA